MQLKICKQEFDTKWIEIKIPFKKIKYVWSQKQFYHVGLRLRQAN